MSANETTEAKTEAREVDVNETKVAVQKDEVTREKNRGADGDTAGNDTVHSARGRTEHDHTAERGGVKPGEHFFTRPPSNIS